VRRILIDAGVVRRRRGPRGRVDVPDALLRELRDEERLSFAAIAEVTGMSKSGVRHRFERMRDGRQRRW
jgi:DNA-binding transcriptional regulator WhiA